MYTYLFDFNTTFLCGLLMRFSRMCIIPVEVKWGTWVHTLCGCVVREPWFAWYAKDLKAHMIICKHHHFWSCSFHLWSFYSNSEGWVRPSPLSRGGEHFQGVVKFQCDLLSMHGSLISGLSHHELKMRKEKIIFIQAKAGLGVKVEVNNVSLFFRRSSQ